MSEWEERWTEKRDADEDKIRNSWNKGCVKGKQRGIPIREMDEGTAEDDSNIWQLAMMMDRERETERKSSYFQG